VLNPNKHVGDLTRHASEIVANPRDFRGNVNPTTTSHNEPTSRPVKQPT